MKKILILLALALTTGCSQVLAPLMDGGRQASNRLVTKIQDRGQKIDTPLVEESLGSLHGGKIYLEGKNHKEDASLAQEGANRFIGAREISQLTPVGNYLVDYEMGGTMVRELLLEKDPFRYEEKAQTIEDPDPDRVDMARRYFIYLTEINDHLSGNYAFDDKDTNYTMVWAKKYKGTDKLAFYFREYMDKTIQTTGNQGIVVLDESDRLVHYLAFGKRNPNNLNHTPKWDENQATKALWKKFNDMLGGYVDDFELVDLYYEVPAFEDPEEGEEEILPQYVGQFESKENIHTVYLRPKLMNKN